MVDKAFAANQAANVPQAAANLVRGHAEASEAPWEALRCLVGDVTYGGRTSDTRDQRVLTAYLGRLFCAAASAPGAALAPAPGYSMPDAATMDAVRVRSRQCISRICAFISQATLHALRMYAKRARKLMSHTAQRQVH